MFWGTVHYFPMFAIFFWVLLGLWVLFGIGSPLAGLDPNRRQVGHAIFALVLIFLLGYKIYPFHA